VPEVVLNNLYKQTQLQDTFGINMVALIDGQPKLCNLKDLIEVFLEHRREVVTRRTVFDLRKARERGHVLEGLAVALANIDEFIAHHQGLAHATGRQGRADDKSWDSHGARNAHPRPGRRRRSADDYRPDGLEKRIRHGKPTGCTACRTSGARNPADASAAPDWPGAGQDRGEYKEVMAHRRPAGHPGHARAGFHHHWRRAAAIKQEFGQTKLGARRSHIEHNAQDLSPKT
jgi:DNA gyrase subunit A